MNQPSLSLPSPLRFSVHPPRTKYCQQGKCTNILAWRLLDEGIDGRLEVGSEYEFDPRGRMNTSLLKHRLLPDGKIPSDPEGLVRILQRAMPHELFDPDAHAMETTVSCYVRARLFVARFFSSFLFLSFVIWFPWRRKDPMDGCLLSRHGTACVALYQATIMWHVGM